MNSVSHRLHDAQASPGKHENVVFRAELHRFLRKEIFIFRGMLCFLWPCIKSIWFRLVRVWKK